MSDLKISDGRFKDLAIRAHPDLTQPLIYSGLSNQDKLLVKQIGDLLNELDEESFISLTHLAQASGVEVTRFLRLSRTCYPETYATFKRLARRNRNRNRS